jgi:hypothetical protein
MTSNNEYLCSQLFVLLPPQVLPCLLNLALAALQTLELVPSPFSFTLQLCIYVERPLPSINFLDALHDPCGIQSECTKI